MAAAVSDFPTDLPSNISSSISVYDIPGHHDGRSGTVVGDKSTSKEASVPQLHQRQGEVHFYFVGRRIMPEM
jgi:hypothetical protein